MRCVHHHHAPLGGGGDVHVVQPDTGTAHHHQVAPGGQHLVGHLRGRSDDQRRSTGHGLYQLFRAEAQLDVDGVPGLPKAVEPRIGDLLGYQDTSHVFIVTAPGPRHNVTGIAVRSDTCNGHAPTATKRPGNANGT